MEITSTSSKVAEVINDSLFLGDLHEDVQEEILSKLPVESLLRFRCASQAWHALTKTSYFISKHIISRHGDQYSDPNHPCLIFISTLVGRPGSANNIPLYQLLGFSLLRGEEATFLKSPFLASPSQRIQGVHIVGCSNGLVCYEVLVKKTESTEFENNNNAVLPENFSMYKALTIVWNPATDKYRCLVPKNYDPDFHLLGFSFVNDRDNSEYKLVRISQHNVKVKGSLQITIYEAQVFVQSTNSWRPVKDRLEFPAECEEREKMTCTTVNGVMYWRVKHPIFQEICILSFDLLEEVFNVIEVPTSIRHLNRNSKKWAIYKWSNSPLIGPFLLGTPDSLYATYWVIRRQESKFQKVAWVEELRFKYEEHRSVLKDCYMIGTWKDQLVFRSTCGINLYLCDPINKTKRKILKNDCRRRKFLQEDETIEFGPVLNHYVESLAPV